MQLLTSFGVQGRAHRLSFLYMLWNYTVTNGLRKRNLVGYTTSPSCSSHYAIDLLTKGLPSLTTDCPRIIHSPTPLSSCEVRSRRQNELKHRYIRTSYLPRFRETTFARTCGPFLDLVSGPPPPPPPAPSQLSLLSSLLFHSLLGCHLTRLQLSGAVPNFPWF